jgi:hypothetical protein
MATKSKFSSVCLLAPGPQEQCRRAKCGAVQNLQPVLQQHFPSECPPNSRSLKCAPNLSVTPETTGGKHRETLQDLRNLGNEFLNRTPIAEEIKARIDKGYYIKFKSFCSTKETISRVKKQPIECEKIFANCSSINIENI